MSSNTKRNIVIFVIMFIFIIAPLIYVLVDNGGEREPSGPLTPEEAEGVLFMREEEKLARDVYAALYDSSGITVFSNIGSSEQQHMDSLLTIVEMYDLDDPVISAYGSFDNASLQYLYDNLTEWGNKSNIDALRVGALIEEVDIIDINEFLENTTNRDVIGVYESLLCGSRNHLRSFVGQLDTLGVDYVPVYLTQDEYDAIVDSSKEKCGG